MSASGAFCNAITLCDCTAKSAGFWEIFKQIEQKGSGFSGSWQVVDRLKVDGKSLNAKTFCSGRKVINFHLSAEETKI